MAAPPPTSWRSSKDVEEPGLHQHGAVLIAVPDADGVVSEAEAVTAVKVSSRHGNEEALDVEEAALRQRRLRRGAGSLWRAAEALLVLAALAASGWYCLYNLPEDVAAQLLGERWRRRSDGHGGASFLLPLYPKTSGGRSGGVETGAVDGGAAAQNSAAAFPGGQHYTTLYIGNPPRPFYLDIDTGSDLTWIHCDAPCTNCTNGPHPLYKPEKGKIIPPRDSFCQELQGNQNYCETCKQCDYEIRYADGASSKGVLARDNMQLIAIDGERQNLDLVFGCAYDQQGKPPASAAHTDGVLGLGSAAISLPAQLASQGMISNVFGHCIATDPSSGGYMLLGDDYIPRWGMTWTPIRNGPGSMYSTEAQKVSYGDLELSVRGQAGKLTHVIFDSGSKYTYFPHDAYTSLIASLKDVSSGFVQDDSDQTLPFCMKASFPVRSLDDVKQLFKPLRIQFRKRWFVIPRTFTILPENYLVISDKGNVCLGVLDGSEIDHSSTIIIGDDSLRGKLIVYDNGDNQIGWVQSDCTKPQKRSSVPFFI